MYITFVLLSLDWEAVDGGGQANQPWAKERKMEGISGPWVAGTHIFRNGAHCLLWAPH